MVHIKRIELKNFKSFGGTTSIPLLPGFTVVSGPNGSGKSNILDALLFCLGISTSKGMRAERLPDLVSHNQSNRRSTVEASVTVTFDLSDLSGLLVDDLYNEGPPENRSGPADSSQEDRDGQQPTENGQEPTGQVEESKAEEGNGEELGEEGTKNGDRSNDNQSNDKEWSISRRLRVTKQGTYTSTYYMSGVPCTLTQLHERMNQLRLYPEGYNVVLQGDVTGIITMNAKERRQIIDELAGVAAFDRKIVQAKSKLDEVKELSDRCRIVEQELSNQRDRLAKDRTKAEQYQKLRQELEQKQQWESILQWRKLKKQEWKLREEIEAGDRSATNLADKITNVSTSIQEASKVLEELNALVKALGEDELLALQSKLAAREAERDAASKRKQELEAKAQETAVQITQTEQEITGARSELEKIKLEQQIAEEKLVSLWASRNDARDALERSREEASALALAAGKVAEDQTNLHRQIEGIEKTLDPQRREQARLLERGASLEQKIQEQCESLETAKAELLAKQEELAGGEIELKSGREQVQSLAEALAAAEAELQTQQETQKRLLEEQRDRQRRSDKLEAQAQALQEATGSNATKAIFEAKLEGVCGLVAQLGRVEPRYQLALETSAGARLGNLVVEDDGVAAAGIQLLKSKRAGRATFLPLNKIKSSRPAFNEKLKNIPGFIDYAVNLIECEERYQNIFAYVFGSTIVFDTLERARILLGRVRIVTLSGEILESSGAMTGGSFSHRSTLHFGTGTGTESRETAELKQRLEEIGLILERISGAIASAEAEVKRRSEEVVEARQKERESQLLWQQLQKEVKGIGDRQASLEEQIEQNRAELATIKEKLQVLAAELPTQEAQLEQWRQELAKLETAEKNSEWQSAQWRQREQEALLQEWETAVRVSESQQQELSNRQQRLEEKMAAGQERWAEYGKQQTSGIEEIARVGENLAAIEENLKEIRRTSGEVEEKLKEQKEARDRAETNLRERHLARQQFEFELQKLEETQKGRRESLAALQEQLQEKLAELPDPLPEIPETVDAKAFESLQNLQKEVRSLQKRLQAMEPVNMLALQEYEETNTRLEELQSKLATLEQERTELLLRIENFTTLRLTAFREAFDAVNQNFSAIFAKLSDGDGYLQIDNPEDPTSGGLTLVAHPKGKPVKRLASMSGGEKSLTALSFIFALQRYRPSPFYAFDEVDMFLDGANVERLAKMIKQEVQQAQFIVVSHKTPMLKSAERIIGVTQARGASTQVIGLKLPSPSYSAAVSDL